MPLIIIKKTWLNFNFLNFEIFKKAEIYIKEAILEYQKLKLSVSTTKNNYDTIDV